MCSFASSLHHLKLPLTKWIEIVYLWSVKTSFQSILKITGISQPAVTRIITKMQEAVRDDCLSNPPTLGGRNTITQIDEAEYGHTQKGHKGRPSTVMLDVWGAVDQETGKLVLCPFKKLAEDGSRRFGPAKTEEVLPLVTRFVKTGG